MSEETAIDIQQEVKNSPKYVFVCAKNAAGLPDYSGLDMLLPDELKERFQSLFQGDRAWRMHYRGIDPKKFLGKFGINYDEPTVRDAIAFDMVKFDEDSVSNSDEYTYMEHIGYSAREYRRFLLNKNFRVNLVQLEPEWSKITYHKKAEEQDDGIDTPELDLQTKYDEKVCVKRTVEVMYQGARLSKTFLEYFKEILDNAFDEEGKVKADFDIGEIYVPFTNANDFTNEIALVPNTHSDFNPITTRAYYDKDYMNYLERLAFHGITAISAFALVDPAKDKNHTGEFLVKVQRKISDTDYRYVVAKIDVNGQLIGEPCPFSSGDNTILCVCEHDYDKDRVKTKNAGTWTPPTDENGEPTGPTMVHSTTSAKYSVFDQRIPDYELKDVRNYFQFKNRLEGMEIFLDLIGKEVWRKEVRASECFAKETMILSRLVNEFTRNKEIMALVMQYYDLMAEWDQLVLRKYDLSEFKDGKEALLRKLLDEYNSIPNNRLDEKLALGQKIKSLKLEIKKIVDESMVEIDRRLDEIIELVQGEGGINDQMNELGQPEEFPLSADELREFGRIVNSADGIQKIKGEYESTMSRISELVGEQDSSEEYGDKVDGLDPTDEITQMHDDFITALESPVEEQSSDVQVAYGRDVNAEREKPVLSAIDTKTFRKYIVQSERWNGFMFNLGYELNQLKTMKTMCEDATIKVRRLVHNFKEKMEDVESQVWDDNHELRKDFSFTGIAQASLREIILLHDWYATNAPGKTADEMGFTGDDKEEKFMEFRKRCNKIAYNLRKNQYAHMLAMQKDRLDNKIHKLENSIGSRDVLKYDDKYGKPTDNEEKPWSIKDVTPEQENRIRLITQAQRVIEEENARNPKPNIVLPERKSTGKVFVQAQKELELELEAANNPNENALPSSRKPSIKEFVDAERDVLDQERAQRQYESDSEMLVDRTMEYLRRLGIAENESDVEKLVLRNKALHYQGKVTTRIKDLQTQKDKLNRTEQAMMKQRDAMKSIIGTMTETEGKIAKLEAENKNIFNQCLYEKNRQRRNNMLLTKLDNENMILELKGIIRKIKTKNMIDFSKLEALRSRVDKLQGEYNEQVREFKDNVGLNQEAIDRLMVGIYNEFQDEILNGVK